MKNVFGDTSDSETESAPIIPPLKKFKPPPKIDVGHKEEQNHISCLGSNGIDEVVPSNGMNKAQVNGEYHDDAPSDNEFLDEIADERPGLGGMGTPQIYNQKASLNESIMNEKSIGLKIMQKMGYIPGQTIGSSAKTGALMEPLSIRIKPARAGIRENTFKPKVASDISSESTAAYQDAVKNKHSERRNKLMISKLQKYCLVASGDDVRLDEGEILVENVNVLWRDAAKPEQKRAKRVSLFGEKSSKYTDSSDSLETGDVSTVDSQHQLDDLVSYVRENFSYCPYCGTTYEDMDDLAQNCPGLTESAHQI